MRTAPQIKDQLLDALAKVLDEPLKAVGFTRKKRSLVYVRDLNEAEQRITLSIHSHPRYKPGAEAHIYPSLQLVMPCVSEVALALVKGAKMLLAGTPEIVLGQPIDFVAPKDAHVRWFATGDEQFVAACDSIRAFLTRWVLPFLSEVSRPADLLRLYETDDARIMKTERWHIFVVAAYHVVGRLGSGREVVRQEFGSPGLRKRYAPLFESLVIE